MNSGNLIPRHCLEARRSAVMVRRWIASGAAYAVVLGVATAACAVAWRSDPTALERRVDEMNTQSSVREKESIVLARQIDEMRRKLAAGRAVSEQPDWSILLALLSDTAAGESAFRRIRLQVEAPAAVKDKEGKPGKAPPAVVTVRLSGVGKSQESPTSLVKRLEETGLFETVKLEGTRLEGRNKGTAVAFEMECRLATGKEKR